VVFPKMSIINSMGDIIDSFKILGIKDKDDNCLKYKEDSLRLFSSEQNIVESNEIVLPFSSEHNTIKFRPTLFVNILLGDPVKMIVEISSVLLDGLAYRRLKDCRNIKVVLPRVVRKADI
jgi:hypothetical protein